MAGLTKQERIEMESFEQHMARKTAVLMTYARPFTSRLSSDDLDVFMKAALMTAWKRRAQFDPEQATLLIWWEGCLKEAALTRKYWRQRHMDYWTTIPAKQLGTERF